jgi:hypothetical protein
VAFDWPFWTSNGSLAKEKAAGHYSVRLSNATAGFPVPPLDKQLTSRRKVPSSGSVVEHE